MAGYYVPSAFSANYVANKKNEDGTYTYDSAVNRAGIDTQRNLQQLNKQYNVTINNAYSQHLLANRGLQASALGTGYKEAFAQKLQASTNEQISQASLSAQDTKNSIFEALGKSLAQIGAAQQQDVNNMRRMASGLEQYQNYLATLTKADGGTNYVDDQQFKVGDQYSFEDNYDKLLGTQKGVTSHYIDRYNNAGLSWEDWFRQNSGTSDEDTAWLDWLYSSGVNQYKDFLGYNKPKSITYGIPPETTVAPSTNQPYKWNSKYKFGIAK